MQTVGWDPSGSLQPQETAAFPKRKTKIRAKPSESGFARKRRGSGKSEAGPKGVAEGYGACPDDIGGCTGFDGGMEAGQAGGGA